MKQAKKGKKLKVGHYSKTIGSLMGASGKDNRAKAGDVGYAKKGRGNK